MMPFERLLGNGESQKAMPLQSCYSLLALDRKAMGRTRSIHG
jgi:hypothetical protein